MAAISHVFTLARVAEMLGEEADWLSEISPEIEPEDGVLYISDVGDDGTPGFTDFGVECLRELVEEYRRQGRHPTDLAP